MSIFQLTSGIYVANSLIKQFGVKFGFYIIFCILLTLASVDLRVNSNKKQIGFMCDWFERDIVTNANCEREHATIVEMT